MNKSDKTVRQEVFENLGIHEERWNTITVFEAHEFFLKTLKFKDNATIVHYDLNNSGKDVELYHGWGHVLYPQATNVTMAGEFYAMLFEMRLRDISFSKLKESDDHLAHLYPRKTDVDGIYVAAMRYSDFMRENNVFFNAQKMSDEEFEKAKFVPNMEEVFIAHIFSSLTYYLINEQYGFKGGLRGRNDHILSLPLSNILPDISREFVMEMAKGCVKEGIELLDILRFIAKDLQNIEEKQGFSRIFTDLLDAQIQKQQPNAKIETPNSWEYIIS